MNNPQAQRETAQQALRRAMRDALGIREEAGVPTPEIPEASEAKEPLVTGAKQGQVGDDAEQNQGADPKQDEALVTGAKQGPSVPKPAHPAQPERTGNGGSIPPKQHRFQPGQSGNPSGRPKNGFNKLVRQLLAADDRKYAKLVAMSLVNHACKGNQSAIHELMARVDSQSSTRKGKGQV